MGQLDKTDVEILQVLQKDAKVNTKELSEKLHISKTPIYERIKQLINKNLANINQNAFSQHPIKKNPPIY